MVVVVVVVVAAAAAAVAAAAAAVVVIIGDKTGIIHPGLNWPQCIAGVRKQSHKCM